MAKVPAAYQASQGSTLYIDKAFYRRLVERTDARRRIAAHTVPIRDGLAWEVPAGHVFHIHIIDGPQVGGFNLWHRHNPCEHFWASRTRQLQRFHVRPAMVDAALSASHGDDHRRYAGRVRH